MADAEHLRILKQGVEVWNAWRIANQTVRVDLRRADLRTVDLTGADLSHTNLVEANLSGAILCRATLALAYANRANLSEANLAHAHLNGANCFGANLFRANLIGAQLYRANLSNSNLIAANLNEVNLVEVNLSRARLCDSNLRRADLTQANLSESDLVGSRLIETNLRQAILVGTNFERAELIGCRVYGAAVWNVNLTDAVQRNIIITPENESNIQADQLEVAQFIYLLLNNATIRHVIDTITSKIVLILGRFTNERKAVLDAIREQLRFRDYVPILFDFDKPESRDLHETITTLARMARFVVADITDAKSIPQELVSVVEQLPSLAVQPILLKGAEPWAMYDHIRRYPWVLPIVFYDNQEELLGSLRTKVIESAEAKVKELRPPSAGSAGTA